MSHDINKNTGKLGAVLPNTVMDTKDPKLSPYPGITDTEFRKCQEEFKAKRLSNVEKFCYGVGHVYNDLCASMWFSYLLIFYEKVLLFNASSAGVILLVGQLADGFSTPIVGVLSDMENKIPICGRYGRRKIWHLIGTICITISFPFIFSPAYGLEESSMMAQSIYYCLFVIVFQFGWASVQISHLALIPDLTPKKSQRTELNSIRYAFTVLSNLSVFAMTFFILEADLQIEAPDSIGASTDFPSTTDAVFENHTTDDPNFKECGGSDTSLQPTDLNYFRTIALTCCAVGLFFSIVFHVGVSEPQYSCPKRSDRTEVRMRKMDWFKQYPFYLVALLYMATRLYVNLYQVYIPLFVQDTLCLAKSAVASVPFTMYLAGFFGSLVMKQFNKVIGRKGTYASGCIIGLAGCIWAYFDGYSDHEAFVQWGIFVVAVMLGSGGSTLLITSLSITADLIGNNTEGGAFVYGLMSFVDKLSNGIIIMVIQDSNTGNSEYYTSILFYACGGACVFGLLITAALIPVKVGKRRGVAASVCALVDDTAGYSGDSSDTCSSDASVSGSFKGDCCEKDKDVLHSISGSLVKQEKSQQNGDIRGKDNLAVSVQDLP